MPQQLPILLTPFIFLAVLTSLARPDEFVMPIDGSLFLDQMGGEAAATTIFGIGTSPSNFVPFYTGLPNNPSPVGEVFAGFFKSGTTVHFGEYSVLGSLSGYAFSNGTDQASIIAFTDVDNSLGMGGSIIQRTGASTWLLHLDDALSYLFDDDDNDVLMQVRVAPVPEPGTSLLLVAAILVLASQGLRVRTGVH